MKHAIPASLPNVLTLLRIALTPVILYGLAQQTLAWFCLAFIMFNVAILTDWLDGLIARRLDSESELGNFLDPLADKILVWGVLGYAALTHIIPWVAYVIIVGRDLAITALRSYLQWKLTPLRTSKYGKLKTIFQFALAYLCFSIWYPTGSLTELVGTSAITITLQACIFCTILCTIFSGIHYFWVNRHLI